MLASLLLAAAAAQAAPAPARVVLLTLDGVRWEEFFGNKPQDDVPEKTQLAGDAQPVFPAFWGRLAQGGIVYGDNRVGNTMEIANGYMVSLPAYQSIMAGATQPCDGNDCGRIGVETLPERLLRELRLPEDQVVVFATWDHIPFAVEHRRHAVKVELSADGRDDRTFPRALQYLHRHKPRLLYISLGDADDDAHARNYKAYIEDLRKDDLWLEQLAAEVDSLQDMPTTLIVSTDHGRGRGALWKDHGGNPDSRLVWLYARGPSVPRLGAAVNGPRHTHLDIRPTIEELFGLCPCPACTAGFSQIATPPASCGR